MRELLLKNLISRDKKRSELFLSEHFEKDGIVQDFEKRTVYRVLEILEFTDTVDLELYLTQKKKEDSDVQTFIIKSKNRRDGISRFIYKVVGHQYVVLADKIYVMKVSQYIKRTASLKKPLMNQA